MPRRVGGPGAARWAGLVSGVLGIVMFAAGLSLCVDRLVVLYSWPEVEARVIESRIITSGSQHTAHIRVAFDLPGGNIVTRPKSDYRSGNYGWIAGVVDRFPVGGTAPVRHNPRAIRKKPASRSATTSTPLALPCC